MDASSYINDVHILDEKDIDESDELRDFKEEGQLYYFNYPKYVGPAGIVGEVSD